MPPCLGVCLVTGGNGFLSSHLARQLSCLPDTTVHIVSADGSPTSPILHDVRVLSADICDAEVMARTVRTVKPNVIFHVAEKVDLRPGYSREMHDTNVKATRHLLQLARAQDECSSFVLTSSIACVSNYNTVVGAKEECTPCAAHPTNG